MTISTRTIAATAVIGAALFAAPLAQAATIDFEAVSPATCSNFSSETLDTEYSGMGVTFDGGWRVLNECGNFGVPARSGDQFASFNTSYTGRTLGATFSSTMGYVEAYVGSSAEGTWTIEGFLGGLSVGSHSLFVSARTYGFLSLAGTFDRVTVTSTTPYGALDDFTFQPVSQVPLPAPALLLVAGLASFGLARRRKA